MKPDQLSAVDLPRDATLHELRKLALKAHLEARQSADLRRDLARRVLPSDGSRLQGLYDQGQGRLLSALNVSFENSRQILELSTPSCSMTPLLIDYGLDVSNPYDVNAVRSVNKLTERLRRMRPSIVLFNLLGVDKKNMKQDLLSRYCMTSHRSFMNTSGTLGLSLWCLTQCHCQY